MERPKLHGHITQSIIEVCMKQIYLFITYAVVSMLAILVVIATPALAQEIPVTTTSNDAKTLFVEGRTLFDNIRFDEARDVFDKALQNDPNFALANIYRAIVATTDKDFDRHLTKALNNKDQVSEGERLLIEAVNANAQNRPMQAIALVKDALEQYPNDKRLHHQLANYYQSSNMTKEAEKELYKVIDLDDQFAPAYNNLGYLYKDMGDYEKAERSFNTYVSLLPEEANPHDSIADLYTKMGEYDLAIEHYNRALQLNPNFYFSKQKIGNNLVFKGLYEDGRKAYKEAIAIAPSVGNKVFMHQALANTYLYEDNFDQALRETDAAIKWAEQESLSENAATLYQIKAFINLEKGDIEEAEKSLNACKNIMANNELTESRKHDLELLSLRNEVLKATKQQDFDKANTKVENIREYAVQSDNKNEMDMYHMLNGIVAYEQNDFTKAVQELKKSDSNNIYGQFYLGMSYQKSGMSEDAKRIFRNISNWNEHTLEFALVRNKAKAMAKMDMAVEE
jgi:tetratricopeptide (TPR) repeat protein